MGVVKVRRTWPCGMQESYEAEGAEVKEDPPGVLHLCPQHGEACAMPVRGGRPVAM